VSALAIYAVSTNRHLASKKIEKVLHLQQIVKITGVTSAGISSKATVPAQQPIRPQPKGLKMRFRPLGFGHGDSSGDEASDEESGVGSGFIAPLTIDSGVEMADAALPEKSHKKSENVENKDKKDRKEKKESPVEIPKASLKRKHAEGKERKSKSSSYESSDIDDRALKRAKRKQIESRSTKADKRLMSTEAHQQIHTPLSSTTPALAILPPASIAQTSQNSKSSYESEPNPSSQSIKRLKTKLNLSQALIEQSGRASLLEPRETNSASQAKEERYKKSKERRHRLDVYDVV
jgi:hypothetical protein